ncbi:MAG: MlaD family protein [Gemmatimonadales bacterium]
MDLHHKQEVTVGALVLLAVALFLAGTMWLGGRSFSNAPELQIVFPDAGLLKRGSPVRVSGVELGQVESIRFEGVGKVVVGISLNEIVEPKIDASARLASVGLVGDAIIAFNPGTAAEPLPEGRVIQGVVDQGLTDLGTDLGAQAKSLMGSFGEFASPELAAELKATLKSVQRTLDLIADTRSGPTAEMVETMNRLQRLTERLDSTVVAADLPVTIRRSDSLMSELRSTTAEFGVTAGRLDTVLQRLNAGEGTLGKLMTDSLLYSDVRRLLGSLQRLVDTLRARPGMLTIQVKVF